MFGTVWILEACGGIIGILQGDSRERATYSGSNDCDPILLPLFSLIVFGPTRCVDDTALELLHALDIGPFEVVQDTRSVKEDMASLLKEACTAILRVRLLEFDKPFPGVLLPVTSNDFGVEGHVFSQTPYFAHLVEVFPDVRGVRKKTGPVGLRDTRYKTDPKEMQGYHGRLTFRAKGYVYA